MNEMISYLKKDSKTFVPALSRGLSVLEALTRDPYEMTLAELSQQLHIPTASLWRIVKVLTEREYLIFDKRRHTYRLGFKLMSMGNLLFAGSHFRSEARDHLKRLAEMTGETTELDVRVRDQLVLLEQVTGPDAIYLYSHPGSAMPYFHATAPGKVYLAQLDPQRVRRILKKLGLPRLTSHTIQDMEQLEKELERVQRDGFAVDVEEMREGVGRVASAVLDRSGRIMACLAVVCPAFRLRESGRKENYARCVKEVAQEISHRYERIF